MIMIKQENRMNVEHHAESQKCGRMFLISTSKKSIETKTRAEWFLNESSNPFLINWGRIHSVMALETNLETKHNSITKFGNQISSHYSNSNKLLMWQIRYVFLSTTGNEGSLTHWIKNKNLASKRRDLYLKNEFFRTNITTLFP